MAEIEAPYASTKRPRVYYNDNEIESVTWLQELMDHGLIPPGHIDDRSILDVTPGDLVGYDQCHFFAGIGGWPLALKLAGVPVDASVWTGSPPCQPFSTAGQQKGREDERHIAPHFISLVRACRPAMLFGEQVASAAVFGKATKPNPKKPGGIPEWAWLDDLSDRLEAALYAVGASDIPSAGIGAPHIRQRTFFGAVDLRPAASGVVHGQRPGLEGLSRDGDRGGEPRRLDALPDGPARPTGATDGLADLHGDRRDQRRERQSTPRGDGDVRNRAVGGLGDSPLEPRERRAGSLLGTETQEHGARVSVDGVEPVGPEHAGEGLDPGQPRPTNGFWRDADWLFCRDGKWRPVEPGTFPLADGIPGRVGLLRGYGNAINPWAAKAFLEAFLEAAQAGLGPGDHRVAVDGHDTDGRGPVGVDPEIAELLA